MTTQGPYFTFMGRADDVFKASDDRLSPFELESGDRERGEHEFFEEDFEGAVYVCLNRQRPIEIDSVPLALHSNSTAISDPSGAIRATIAGGAARATGVLSAVRLFWQYQGRLIDCSAQ